MEQSHTGFVFMIENKQNPRENGTNWWKPAVEIFTQISGWIIGPIVVALILGKMLDNHYDTKPVILLVSVGVSFLITCVGMVRVIKNYTRKLKEIEKNDKV